MKVAFIRRTHAPQRGAEKLLTPLMRRLVEEEHDVHILSEHWPEAPGVTIHRIAGSDATPSTRLHGFVTGCQRVLQKEEFDLSFAWDLAYPVDIFRPGDGLCDSRNRALRDIRGLIGRQMAKLDAAYRAQLAVEKQILTPGGCSHVLANSLRIKFEIVRTYALSQERVHVIHNGVDTNRFDPRERSWWRPETRKKLGASDEELVALFVGSDFERQGLDLALEALAAALPRSSTRLVVAGPGDAERFKALALKLEMADRLHLLGPVDVVQQYYAAADLYIHPARYDPFPNAILEALACGLPVLTTPECGGSEAIEDGKSGYIVENTSQLVDGIRLIADANRRAEMGELARRRALQFELEDQVTKLAQLMDRVLTEKAAALAGAPDDA